MSRAQYEADPQTMWRAEGADRLGGVRTAAGFTRHGTHWKSSGLHFGDYNAARERGESLATLHAPPPPTEDEPTEEPEPERPIRMFSLRTKGRFSNEPIAGHPAVEVLPQTKGVAPDEDIGDAAWAQRSTGRWYLNEAEGYKSGTDRGPALTGRGANEEAINRLARPPDVLSGYVPRRRGFMTTHSEEVLQAHAEGKSVHPTILQQAQIGPEYSETIEPATMVDRKEGVRTLARPEHPSKLFQTLNPHAGKGEQIDIPTIGGGVIEHYRQHSHARHVSNEDYDEMLRKHADPTETEPILSHIGKSRPAGTPRP